MFDFRSRNLRPNLFARKNKKKNSRVRNHFRLDELLHASGRLNSNSPGHSDFVACKRTSCLKIIELCDNSQKIYKFLVISVELRHPM